MSKGNYLFLGIAISYLVVATIQFSVPGVISASVFVTVAFVSLELTILETVKIISNNFVKTNKVMVKVAEERCLEIENILSIIKKYSVLEEDTNKLQDEKAYLKDIIKTNSQSRKIIFIEKATSLLSAFQIVFSIIQIIVTPLKIIPYDIFTTKTINIVTLLAFSMMFFSLFASNVENDRYERIQEKLLVNKKTSKYYLNLLTQIQKEHEDKQGVIL